MQRVLVISTTKTPLMPCHQARARQLLRAGRARVWRREPFTIILIDREEGATQPVELRVDPGSRTTGMALVAHCRRGQSVLWAAHLAHRGITIRKKLDARRAQRRARRGRKARYRPARFDNRRRPQGWLPPSLRSRVDNVHSWAARLSRLSPVASLAVETVRFDTQKLARPEISGTEYHRGSLFGYEVREYLLEKWQRRCAYCKAENVPLEIDHIHPRSRGGSDRVGNLTIACRPCNQKKGSQSLEAFVTSPQRRGAILAQATAPLRDAAAVNATRFAVGRSLRELGLPVSFWSGGRTKFNRTLQGYPKDHWIDAACVGEQGSAVSLQPFASILQIEACGRGARQRCRVDRFGFPRTGAKSLRVVHGFKTGDLVQATVSKGKKMGSYRGKVAVRATGFFNIKTPNGTVQGISHCYCRLLQRSDGYTYAVVARPSPGALPGFCRERGKIPPGADSPPRLLPALKGEVSAVPTPCHGEIG